MAVREVPNCRRNRSNNPADRGYDVKNVCSALNLKFMVTFFFNLSTPTMECGELVIYIIL